MTAAFYRSLLVLALLAVGSRWLDAGLARLFQVQDAPALIAYQRALPQGKNQAIDAMLAVAGTPPALFIANLYWHKVYGWSLSLLISCLTAAYLAWRRRVSWLLPLLFPFATAALAWSGLYRLFKWGLYEVLNEVTLPVSLPWLFMAQGIVGVGVFLALAVLAFRAVPPAVREPSS